MIIERHLESNNVEAYYLQRDQNFFLNILNQSYTPAVQSF